VEPSTYHNVKIPGVPFPVGMPNVTEHLQDSGYYVSYNNHDRGLYGCDTTAIVIDRTGAFLILNGDHRDAIRGMSLAEACEYFHENKDKKNFRSDGHQDDVLVEVDGHWKIVRKTVGEE